MPNQDLFSLIAEEIMTKQNGLDFNRGDDTILKEMFANAGGDLDKLQGGVLAQFDLLKDQIVTAYQSGRIGSQKLSQARIASLKADPDPIKEQLAMGRAEALRMAGDALGKKVLSVLLFS